MALSKAWTDTIDMAKSDKAWDDYDTLISGEVADYNSRFSFSIDWKFFKALVWTESGGPPSGAWKTRAMQIGNKGDPAWAVVKAGKENTAIIRSAAVKKLIDDGTSIENPSFNIKVGLVYAVTRCSIFSSVVSDSTMRTYEVVSGDNPEKIARKAGTTVANLMANNPNLNPATLQIKQKLNYQLATIRPTSCTVNAAALQSNYNGNGDHAYAEKIAYCLKVMEEIVSRKLR
jgi:LysM domain